MMSVSKTRTHTKTAHITVALNLCPSNPALKCVLYVRQFCFYFCIRGQETFAWTSFQHHFSSKRQWLWKLRYRMIQIPFAWNATFVVIVYILCVSGIMLRVKLLCRGRKLHSVCTVPQLPSMTATVISTCLKLVRDLIALEVQAHRPRLTTSSLRQ